VAQAVGGERERAGLECALERHSRAGQGADGVGHQPEVGALRLDEGPAHRSPVAGHHDARRRGQAQHDVHAERPVEREAVGAVRGRRRLLDQVAGQQHIDVGDVHDQVSVGVATARVQQLDHPVAEVEGGGGGEGPVGREDEGVEDLLPVRVVGVVAVVALDPLAGRRRGRGGVLVGVDRHVAVHPAEGGVPERVVEVAVGVDHRNHLTGGQAAQVVDHPRRGEAGAVGVDHHEAAVAPDGGHVDVEPVVARYPDPCRHLGEVGHGRTPARPPLPAAQLVSIPPSTGMVVPVT
jgi:hypothetical protein